RAGSGTLQTPDGAPAGPALRCPSSGPSAIASTPPRPSDHGRLGGVNPEGSRVVEAGSSLKRTPCARVPPVPQRWVVADSRCALVELPAYFVDARCQARPAETFDDDLEEGDFELVLRTAQECSALLAAWVQRAVHLGLRYQRLRPRVTTHDILWK